MPSTHYRNDSHMSIPFHNKQTNDTSNALVAFDCPNIANAIKSAMDISNVSDVREVSLADLVDQATMLKMPVAVILSAYCDVHEKTEHFEIHYTDPRSAQFDASSVFPNFDEDRL